MEPTKGIVQDSDGNPVSNALVAVEKSSVPFPDMAFRTDSKGRFEISFPVGERVRLAARAPEGGYGFTDFEIKPSNTVVVIKIIK